MSGPIGMFLQNKNAKSETLAGGRRLYENEACSTRWPRVAPHIMTRARATGLAALFSNPCVFKRAFKIVESETVALSPSRVSFPSLPYSLIHAGIKRKEEC